MLTQLGLTQLAVDQAGLSMDASLVKLDGRVRFRSLDWAATLTAATDDSLSLSLHSSARRLTIKQLFGVQPPVIVRTSAGALVPTENVLDALPIDNPKLEARTGADRAAFSGLLLITNDLLIAPYISFLGDRLEIAGTADFSAVSPKLDLKALTPKATDGWVASIGAVVESSGLALGNEGTEDDLDGLPIRLATVEFFAKVSQPAVAELRAPLLRNDSQFDLALTFSQDSHSLKGGLTTIAKFLGGGDTEKYLSLPPGLDVLDKFYVKTIGLGIDPNLGQGAPSLKYTDITITSREPWRTPVPFINVEDVGTQWTFHWLPQRADGSRQWMTTGSVFGTFRFGAKKEVPGSGWPLSVVAFLPKFDVWVHSEESLEIPIADALKQFSLNPGKLPSLQVNDIDILGQWDTRTVTASMSVSGDWEIKLKAMSLKLEGLTFQAIVAQNFISGSVEGIISIDLVSDKATFLLAAEYPGAGNWVFSGGLVDGTLPLLKFVAAFFGQTPNWGADITLTELFFRYDTGTNNPYSVRGRAVAHWNIGDALGIQKLEVEAFGSIEKRAKTADDAVRALAAPHLADGDMIYAGEFSGAFTVNKIKIGAGLTFDDATKTYFFYVDWETGQIKAIASLVDADNPVERRRVITITLKGVTVGDLVERLVNLVNPNLNYTLDPPWDVLNRIDLSRFSLVIDYKKSKVQLRFQADLGIPLLKLDWVGVTYDRSSGEPSVRFELGGQFLDKTYGKDNKPPLSWDAIKDPPPETPGKGVRLIDIRYFGLGQHVTIADIAKYQSVATLVETLRGEMVPPKQGQANPIAGTSLIFAPDSQWLIGLDLKVMEFLRVAVVLNDPSLYGMVISLSGEKAKSLAGLSFELLYKKVTDDIGMFRVRLQIPEAYREINLGAVAITMGVITVDIYTNGNFRVDLGFPAKRDFSNSFGFQFGPFNGKGGLYFALLNGATSTRVPAVTNGNFSPVIELGIGLQVGVGRTFNKGPLSAGLTVDVEGVFMGVLGWFHPDDAAKGTELYYWVQGIVAITGKLYGKVDFKIISVSISIEAHASVTVTVECYMPTLIELEVGVTVEAEVDLCLFTISFSFDMTLQASFTIGQAEPTPWILAADQSGRGRDIRAAHARRPAALRRRPADMARLTHPAFHATRTALAAGEEWNPEQSLFKDGAAVGVHLFLTPAFPVADIPVHWPGGSIEPAAPPRRCIDLLLAATPPAPRVPGVADVSFNNLIDIAFRWALTGAGVAPFDSLVTPATLAEVARLLDGPVGNQGFSYANLKALFARNLRLRIELAPTGSVSNGVAFPMPPPLAWTGAEGLPDPRDASRNFADYMPVDADYEAALKAYLDALLPAVPVPETVTDTAVAAAAVVEPSESMATFVFRDYFQMIAKAAVAKAADLLGSGTVSFDPNKSLAAAAGPFETTKVTVTKNAGDTLDQVAASLSYSGPEIAFLNLGIAEKIAAAAAGASIELVLGITPQAIALANPGLAFRAGTLALGDLSYQVRAGQSLGVVATLFGLDLKTWLAGAELVGTPRLLAPGAELPLAGYAYDNNPARTTATLAAILFVRLNGSTGVPLAEWYAQRIVDLNPGLKLDPFDPGLPVTAASLLVPDAYQSEGSIEWKTLAGDTVRDLAAYCALVQNGAADPGFADFQIRFLDRNPGTPTIVHLPDSTSTWIGTHENLAVLAERLLLAPAGDTFVDLVKDARILRPLAPVMVRGARATVTDGESLADLSRAYGIDIETIASRVAELPELYAATAIEIVVPHLVAMKIQDLVDALLADGRATELAKQVSRFMLHGLRIPAPARGAGGAWAPTGPFAALYALTGQQVLGPAPSTPPAVPITIPFSVPGDKVNWLQLGAVPDPHSSGAVTVTVTDDDLADFGCEPALRPDFDVPPPPLGAPPPAQVAPLWTDQSPRWDLSQHILLQLAETIPLPGPAGAKESAPMPGLWPLPPALLARAGGASDYSLDVVAGDGTKAAVRHWAWAATIDFQVRRVPGAPDLFEVFGADTAARQQLLRVWTDLTGHPGNAKLLYRPSAAGGLPPGLVAPSLDAVAGAYLIKENLSTETHSGVLAQRALLGEDAPVFVAPISAAKAFLQLLWESSVVGGGGFWLRAAGPDGAPALPGSAFGSDGRATLTVLVTIDEQLAAEPVRRLLAFNNCAIIGDSIDPSARLTVSTEDIAARLRLPTVQPGNVGFEFVLFRPPPPPQVPDPDADKQARTRRYYQLAGYQLIGNDTFAQQGPSVPVGPLKAAESDDGRDRWRYSQILPAARLAARHPLPELAGLPDPLRDPYAGIRLIDDKLAALRVDLWFQDMLGNATAGAPAVLPPEPQPAPAPLRPNQLDIPVGYMDPVIGFGSWPAATAAFQVANAGTVPTPTLKAMLGFQPGPYQPGPNEVPELVRPLHLSAEETPNAPTTSRQRAADHRDRYASIYFQIMQSDVEANLLTSLYCGADRKPIRLGGQIQTLRSFAIAAWTYLSAAARLSNMLSDAECLTLDDVSTRHGVWFQGLAAANAAIALASLFKPVQIFAPRFAIVRAGDTPLNFAGPEAAPILEKPQNIVLPLRAGVSLKIPRKSLTTPAAQASTFATLAEAAFCTTAALIQANIPTAGLLTLGFVFQHQDAEVKVGHGDTSLDDIARTFREQAGIEVDALTLGMENADAVGLVVPNAAYWVDSYTAQAGDTLAANKSGAGSADLAAGNVETPDIYVAGTPVFLGAVDASAVRGLPLQEAAQAFGISGEQLLAYNHDTPSNPVVLPGHASAPADPTIPYAVKAEETLDAIAGRFAAPSAPADPVHALAEANATLPGLLAAGLSISMAGRPKAVETRAGDSLKSVADRFAPAASVAELADAIRGQPGYLAAGSTMLCPAASITGGSLAGVALSYGVEPVSLALANAGTPGLLKAGARFAVSKQGKDYEVVLPSSPAASLYPLNSIATQFAKQHVEVTLAEVAATNRTADIFAPCRLILPAPPLSLAAELDRNATHLPGEIFPLQAWIEIRRREEKLVLSDFRGTEDDPSPAQRSLSAVAALGVPRQPDEGSPADPALALAAFATSLETAMPKLRVCTGKVAGHADDRADAWAIGFGEDMIDFAVRPEADGKPRFFAIRPLFNHLVTRTIQIAELKPDGSRGLPATTEFQSVDAEIFARDFLTDIDLFLSAPYAAAAYRGAKTALERLIAAKAKLAAAVADGLAAVLKDQTEAPPTPTPPDLAAARAFLAQRLLGALGKAWQTDLVLQYATAATHGAPRAPTARLAGTAVAAKDGADGARIVIDSGKIDLAAAMGYLNLSITLQHGDTSRPFAEEARQSFLRLHLGYAAKEVEFNIHEVAEGYVASDWLSFVLPLDPRRTLPGWSIDLGGLLSAPLPLRSYPEPAVLSGHGASPTHPATTDWAQAPFWTYSFTYQHASAAQDQIRFDVVFNKPDLLAVADMVVAEDIFAVLAEYHVIRSRLWDILKNLPASRQVEMGSPIAAAIGVLAGLAERAATAWHAHWAGLGAGPVLDAAAMKVPVAGGIVAPALEAAQYLSSPEEEAGLYVRLILDCSPSSTGPVRWPAIKVAGPVGDPFELIRGVPVGNRCVYAFPEGTNVEVGAPLIVAIAFAGLHVARYQRATADVAVIRNARLLGPDGPATADAFRFETLPVAFPAAAVPLLVWDKFELGAWTAGGEPLATAMSGLLDGLVAGERPVSFLLEYGYELVESAEMRTRLPIALKPAAGYLAADADAIARHLAAWQSAAQPSTRHGEWVFSPTLFSSIGADPTKPLLQIRQLVSRIAS